MLDRTLFTREREPARYVHFLHRAKTLQTYVQQSQASYTLYTTLNTKAGTQTTMTWTLQIKETKIANTTNGLYGRTRLYLTLHLDFEEGPLSRCLAASTYTWTSVQALFWWLLTLILLREIKKRANTANGLYGRVYSYLALLRGGPTHQAVFVVGPLSRCHAAILLQGL